VAASGDGADAQEPASAANADVPATATGGAAVAAAEGAQKIVPLEGDEAQAVVLVLESLINRYAHIFG
jgi:hypothetical protein